MKISTPFIALALKLTGLVMLVSAITDYLFLIIPFEWQNQNWQITTTNNLVDRAIIPLLGILFMMIGWWISDNASSSIGKPMTAVRLPVFIISSIFGLIFLLLVPLHLSNVSRASSNVVAQIDQQAGQQEEQIQNFIGQLDTISKNPQRLSQEIARRNQVIDAGGRVQGRQLNAQQINVIVNQRDQLQQLLDLSKEPAKLTARLDEIKNRLQTQLQELEDTQKQKASVIALKQSIRTGINSLVASIAYIVVGWLGIKAMGKPKSTKAASR